MNKNILMNTMILSALAVPGLAMAEDASPVSANVSLVSNYLYRGLSQTGDRGAIQGGFDYAHASGLYAGVWGSNISWLSDTGTASKASFELDTYIGFSQDFATDFSYDVGVLRYNYPGEYAVGAVSANTDEVYGAIGWKWLKAKYSHSTSNLFGVADSKGSSYAELNGSYDIEAPGISLSAHYGKQSVAGTGNDVLTYSDYNVKAVKDFGGYSVGLAVSKTDISGDKTAGVVSLSRAL